MDVQNQYALLGRSPPSSDYRFFFVLDPNAPLSLVGSVIEARTEDSERYATVLVTCAPGSGCPTDFPEQTITHLKGSSWAGEYAISGTTTTWGCDLGQGSDDTLPDQGGWCSSATVASAEEMGLTDRSTRTGTNTRTRTEAAVNTCFVDARSKLVFVTAGNDKWSIVEPTKPTLPPESYLKKRLEWLKSLHCPMTMSASTTGEATAGTSARTITKPPVTATGISSAASSALQTPSSAATTASSGAVGGCVAGSKKTGLVAMLLGASALVALFLG